MHLQYIFGLMHPSMHIVDACRFFSFIVMVVNMVNEALPDVPRYLISLSQGYYGQKARL